MPSPGSCSSRASLTSWRSRWEPSAGRPGPSAPRALTPTTRQRSAPLRAMRLRTVPVADEAGPMDDATPADDEAPREDDEARREDDEADRRRAERAERADYHVAADRQRRERESAK